MVDYNYQQLMEQINSMSPWQIVAASAVTAEKVRPIVRSLALPDTWRTTQRCLDLTWRSVRNLQAGSEEAERLLQELNAAPEWQCEYPDTLVFCVSKSLDLIRLALETIIAGSPSQMADSIGFSHILDVADELDVAASDCPDLLSDMVQIRNAEKSSQMSVVAAIARHESPSSELLEMLQHESKSVSKLIELALPTFCYSFVSALCRNESK